MTQLPDRATIGGGGDVTKAAAEIFSKVRQDNIAAEARLRRKEKEKPEWAAARGITLSPSPAPALQPTVEIHESELGPLNEQSSTEEQEASQTKERAARKSPRMTAQKRSRDDKEAEALAEKERKERDARLRRERSAEAEKRRDKRRAAAEAAKVEAAKQQLVIQNLEESLQEEERKRKQLQKEKADRELLEAHQQISEQYERERQEYQAAKAAEEAAAKAAQQEAAKAAMPPPPPPPAVTLTPVSATIPTDAGTNRPGSARSFVEEDNVFHDAGIQTPTPPSPKGARRAGPPPPPPPPQPAQPAAAKPVSPPSVLKKPPRRPGGTPASRKTVPGHRRTASQQGSGQGELTIPDQPQQASPSEQRTISSYATRLRSRFKPVPGRASAEEQQLDTRTSPNLAAHGPGRFGVRSGTWSVLKIIGSAFLMLHFIRVFNVVIRPDLFETPVMSIKWHGWNNMSSWANNVGQFFPSPLLHPLGVLTNDQYDDLKDYLQRRTATTEATVNDLKSVLPKVVSVRKDGKGKIIIADELWNALKDRIDHDSSILSLDKKSRISDKHWQAVSKRLEDAGLRKPLSASDVEKIVAKSAPVSWEKWLKNNKQLVADIIGQPKGAPKGSGEAVVSKEEFIGELKHRLAETKKGIDAEMDVLRKEFRGLIPEVKKIASSSGMTKADTAALIKQVVDKEITRRIAGIGSGSGGKSSAATIDSIFRRQVNHFSPGNGAQIDVTLTSPIYKIDRAAIGSKEWVKKRNEPRFMQDASQALTAWTDPGHCWCAGTQGEDDTNTLPALLAVRLPNFIVPQTVILEHIAPSATTDRGATPKDVEIWAMFDEHGRRERALDWMGAQYPGSLGAQSSRQEQGLVQKGFAKIGHFKYEHRARDEGVFVHALSRDLVDRLKAATDLVVVRAVTNYGAKDHTCFYRVRLYGEMLEGLEKEKESRKWF
jgi:hypothetical protein